MTDCEQRARDVWEEVKPVTEWLIDYSNHCFKSSLVNFTTTYHCLPWPCTNTHMLNIVVPVKFQKIFKWKLPPVNRRKKWTLMKLYVCAVFFRYFHESYCNRKTKSRLNKVFANFFHLRLLRKTSPILTVCSTMGSEFHYIPWPWSWNGSNISNNENSVHKSIISSLCRNVAHLTSIISLTHSNNAI